MLHAGFLLAFMLAAAPLASYVPLASLAAVLVIVARNMSEIDKFRHLLSAPPGDTAVRMVTFGLTVMVDLPVVILVGVVLAAILLMPRMDQEVQVEQDVGFLRGEVHEAPNPAPTFAFP